jgi:hypothetical protein
LWIGIEVSYIQIFVTNLWVDFFNLLILVDRVARVEEPPADYVLIEETSPV